MSKATSNIMFGIRTPKKTHRRKQSSGQYYFVDRSPGVSELVRDEGDNVDVIELKGDGNSAPLLVDQQDSTGLGI